MTDTSSIAMVTPFWVMSHRLVPSHIITGDLHESVGDGNELYQGPMSLWANSW